MPPQMGDLLVYPPSKTPQSIARDARIKHWLDLSAALGHNTESSVEWLHVGSATGQHMGDDSTFYVGYEDGELSPTHHGLYAGLAAHVTIPSASWKSMPSA